MKNNLLDTTPNSPMAKVEKLIELQNLYKTLKPQIEDLKADLLQTVQKLDVYTLKTGQYTISRAKRITPQIVNFKQLKESLDKANIPYETEEVFTDQTKVMFKEAIEEKRDLPGLEGKETEYISIRIRENELKINPDPDWITKGNEK